MLILPSGPTWGTEEVLLGSLALLAIRTIVRADGFTKSRLGFFPYRFLQLLRRRGVRRAAPIVGHRVTEELDVLALGFDVHRARRQPLGLALGLGRDDAPSSSLAGDITGGLALKGRALD